jgi:hypothetical protein
MPPSRVRRVWAVHLAGLDPGYLLREAGEDDDAWKRVKARAICTLPVHEGKFLPETVTVTFTDDTVRIFNPHDWVDIGPNNDYR